MAQPLISIIVPVWNEEEFLPELLRRVRAAPLPGEREILVVDDGSTDGSAEIAEAEAAAHPGLIRVFRHGKNRGKGAAVRTALGKARGEFTVIQDADLEYDPREYERLLGPLLEGRAEAVFGTRFAVGVERRVLYFWHSLANRVLTTLVNVVADLNLTDVWTCYKAARTELLRSIPITSPRFGFEPEITIKLAQRQVPIYETPVSYHGRTYEEGKKIGKWDAVAAVFTILRCAVTRNIYREAGPEILDILSRAPRFNRWMAETVTPFLGRRVMEIGSGIGNLSRHLAPRRERYLATDIDAEHLARLRARFSHRPHMEVRHCNLAEPGDFDGLEGSVDAVVCLNVLEHVEDDRTGLANIYRALAPGGRAVVLVPEGMSVYGTLDEALGHCRRYSEEELRGKMTEAGLEVERVLYFNRPTRPGWFVNGRILKRRTFSRFQIWVFDRLVWFWRRIDGWLPWRPTSLIAVGRKPE
ncbi:MAG TPA: glycosyltransferase [Bryobacteraceae bacterium]|nr:glycosyl transferase [Bryobacterales bacterium]HRJ19917.1 glycosyltransferase [Bryobacteraceae bacterium]